MSKKKEKVSTASLNSNLNNLNAKPENGASGAFSSSSNRRLKIKFVYKFFAFVFSVVALSWFFEGTRQMQAGLSVSAIVYVLAGSLLTVALIGVQAFFIYAEEKSKDNRTRKIRLFDAVYERLTRPSCSDKSDESTDPETHGDN
ncbi:MAG: hypothetical protein C0464_01750 [Cyanobacteria bacterium DS2.008]|nr:hypothetical protein [Cyanobacteria bacterium DS2.008]MDQ5933003.1 hypothetical protein [Cyanobacteriota bacterium erpe_2018_sw_21hr_WHONDRS-SW48-000092_B_bin.40]